MIREVCLEACLLVRYQSPRLIGINRGMQDKSFSGEAVGVVDLEAETWLESLLPWGLEGALA